MTEVDLLKDLMNSNPNEPAAKGTVLLLRAEMKSEFKTVREKLELHDRCFEHLNHEFKEVKHEIHTIKNSLELVAQQVAILVARP